MLCEQCNETEASVHQIEMSGGEITHLQLCESCAEDMSGDPSDSGASVSSLASSLFEESTKSSPASCEGCGMTFAEFRKRGRVGCSQCYDAFRGRMESLVHRIHGADQHVGASSSGRDLSTVSPERKRQLLEKRLERKVQEEEYEEAADLRDKIAELDEGES